MSSSNVSYVTGRRITLAGVEYGPREEIPVEVVSGLPVRNFNALVQTHSLVPAERAAPHHLDAPKSKSQVKRRAILGKSSPSSPAA